MTSSLVFTIIISILVYILCVLLLPKSWLSSIDPRMKASLKRLADEQKLREHGLDTDPLHRSAYLSNPLSRAYLFLPGAARTLPMFRRAGLASRLHLVVLGGLVVFVALVAALSRLGWAGVLIAGALTFILMWVFLLRAERKQRRAFIDAFPDALDMIVRSVRSGYPLHAALGMVAENLRPPVSTEFKRIVDEISYGWTLNEALNRFAERFPEPDIRFFVVVLAVQQESGGNLSEVLNNLSRVLRQRKMLRLKVRSLSSEGRAAAWILSLLPFFIIGAVNFVAPRHFDIMFTTSTGIITTCVIFGIIGSGMLLIKRMITIDI